MRDVRTSGETPLHKAAAYGDAKIIELLLKNGAQKETKDAIGDTPLIWILPLSRIFIQLLLYPFDSSAQKTNSKIVIYFTKAKA